MAIKKIAYISFIKDPWGGSEQLWYLSAKEAQAKGIKVVVSSVDVGQVAEPFKELVRNGAKHYLRRGFINPNWKRNVRIFHKIKYAALNLLFNPFNPIIKEKPDVIVFTGASYSMLLNKALFKAAQKQNIPIVQNIQVNIEYTRPINQEEARYLRSIYAYVSASAFVSRRNLTVTERHLAARLNNAEVLCNPVNLSSTEIVPFPKTSPIRLAIVANLLVNHKGHDLLLEVLSAPKWRERGVELHIYGTGYDKGYIEELIRFFDLSKTVFLEGKANDIRKVWEGNHVLVMPSLNEGMALAVIEAMICGRPVVTTDVGGNLEWIEDSENGFIAEGANVWSFDKALERAWQRKDDWEMIGKKAHERAFAQHDPTPGKTFFEFILKHGDRS